jgi:hypothetical protein
LKGVLRQRILPVAKAADEFCPRPLRRRALARFIFQLAFKNIFGVNSLDTPQLRPI